MKTDENFEISVISTTEETAIVPSVFNESRSHHVKRCVCCVFRSLLPTRKQLNFAFTKGILLLLFCGSVFGVLQENALPGTETFSLILLAVLSFMGGQLFGMVQLPPLVGMLIVGFLYRNISVFPFSADISHKTASTIRDISLVIILLSSGVGLDGQKLHRLKCVVLQLTCIPLFVEVGCMTVFAHFLLELPWTWAVMLGFIVSAVSVSVILPILLRLRRKGLGSDKGILTLILAASSLDDIVSITGFTITLSIVFSEAGLALILIKAPLEPLVGCAVGAVFGVLFWHFPSRTTTKASLLVYYNVLLLCLGGLCLMLVSKWLNLSGSGALGCVTLAYVSTLAWRRNPQQMASIEYVIGILWKITEPFMFALIGSQVSVDNLHSHIGYSLLSLFLALLCRLLVTPFVTFGANLNAKEKIFVSCAWLPKAAVQAAIGSQALDYARLKGKGTEMIEYGEQLLTVSVLSILITAPLGAALATFLGPRLLSKDLETGHTSVNQEETSDTTVKKPPSNYGSCHQLQPSNVLLNPKTPESHIPS